MGKCLRGTSNCIRFAFFDYVLESRRGEISVESFKHSTHEKFVYKSLNTKTEIHAIRIDRSEGSLTFFPALTFVSNREGCGGWNEYANYPWKTCEALTLEMRWSSRLWKLLRIRWWRSEWIKSVWDLQSMFLCFCWVKKLHENKVLKLFTEWVSDFFPFIPPYH